MVGRRYVATANHALLTGLSAFEKGTAGDDPAARAAALLAGRARFTNRTRHLARFACGTRLADRRQGGAIPRLVSTATSRPSLLLRARTL
jgi:hypothetical protein